jgi:hypothetical protein
MNAAYPGPRERHYFKSDEFTHSSYLSVSAFGQHELQLVGFFLNDICFPELFSIEFHSFPKKIESCFDNLAANAYDVLFGDGVYRMDQLPCDYSVFSQNQQSAGVDIEPTRNMDCGPMWGLAFN